MTTDRKIFIALRECGDSPCIECGHSFEQIIVGVFVDLTSAANYLADCYNLNLQDRIKLVDNKEVKKKLCDECEDMWYDESWTRYFIQETTAIKY